MFPAGENKDMPQPAYEIRLIIPVMRDIERELTNNIRKAIRREISVARSNLRKTHSTWNEDVSWQQKFGRGNPPFYVQGEHFGPDTLYGAVFTYNKVYGWVNDGTSRHKIPRTARRRGQKQLVFQLQYKAKTTPGVIGSKQGGKFGPTVTASQVDHPGLAGRDFNWTIASLQSVSFSFAVQAAIVDATSRLFIVSRSFSGRS
jgi:hypothetical protein